MKNFSKKTTGDEASDEWSRGIQRGRLMQRMTQSELARLAGVTITTVYRAERGLPVRESSLRKICAGLDIKFDEFLRMKPIFQAERQSHVVHRAAGAYWYAQVDRRRTIPEDNEALTQDFRERRRLGRLGLTPIFACYPNMIMPEGPGAAMIELYGRYEHPFSPTTYRDCMMLCQRGAARLRIRDDVVELSEGDIVGFTNRDLGWIEPAAPLAKDGLPPLVLWFGAVRLGKILAPPGKRTIIRKPRADN